MGFFDKVLTGGGIVLAGLIAGSAYGQAQETRRRRSSPLCFDEGVTQTEFIAMAREVARRTPRVKDVVVNGMSVALSVRSNSGLSSWTAEIDFNDYGHLTGTYWLTTDNSASLIPEHLAKSLQAEIRSRIGGATRRQW